MATIKYLTEPRTLSEADFPVLVNSHNNWQSPDTVVHQGSRSGREHRGGHFPLDGNRWGGVCQDPESSALGRTQQTQEHQTDLFPETTGPLWDLHERKHCKVT